MHGVDTLNFEVMTQKGYDVEIMCRMMSGFITF
jgi:hypothetical protein